MTDTRTDGRACDELRPISFELDYQRAPAASVLVSCGNTRVICAASVLDSVPRWMSAEGKQGGWVTAEYQMLPGSTGPRCSRERSKPSGRSSEIQRLIGRSLRSVVDLEKLPGKTISLDCDVLDADGGTRCASICGSAVALELALLRLSEAGQLTQWPLVSRVAAVSVGMLDGREILDLCYEEDSAAAVDMNVVMTSLGEFVELQGTAEEHPFTRDQLTRLLAIADKGVREILELQKAALASRTT
ncbi:MAG: ribonuclease PH [Victivallales bacterium]|nr:ribonuclease PH [Victivallales bacterium]